MQVGETGLAVVDDATRRTITPTTSAHGFARRSSLS